MSFHARRRDRLVTVRWQILSVESDFEVWRRSVSPQDPVDVDRLLVDTVNDLSFEAIQINYGQEVRIAAERIGKAPWQVGSLADYLRGQQVDQLSYLGPFELLRRFADGDLPRTPEECDAAWHIYEHSYGRRA